MTYTSFESMPLVLGVCDIADTLCVGKNTAYALVNSGQIASVRIGNQYRIFRDEFIRFIKEGAKKVD